MNVWSFDLMRLPTPGVPLLKHSIENFRQHHFRTPAVIPLDIVVGVDSAEAAQTALDNRCARLISAPEVLYAYLEAVALDLKKGDDDLLARWRSTMLCCPCLFRKVESNDALHRLSLQFREDLAQAYTTMRFSALQKMYDVQVVMERLKQTTGCSAEKVAQYYKTIRYAASSDPVTFEFVDCSLTVLKRLLNIPSCCTLLLELEELGLENPLDSIYKLHKVIIRGATRDNIEWSLHLMIDLWRSGALKTDQLSVRHLDGKCKGSDGKGIVELMCFKAAVLRHLMGEFMDTRTFTDAQKALLRGVCSHGITEFRRRCGYVHNRKHGNKALPDCPIPLYT